MSKELFASGWFLSGFRKLPVRAVLFAVAAGSVQAQTAPQLLPYTAKLIAGGGSAIGSGATCPVSGNISTDAYGDGCLATEIILTAPRYAAADSAGNIFFSDYTNGLVRRIDATTGVVSAVAGGAGSSPAAGASCPSGVANISAVSLDARGDGCLSTAVKISKPAPLAFSPSGDLYFGDIGYADVRKVAATGGLVPAGGGIISNVAGNLATTYGYTANNPSGNIVAATGSYLDAPYGLAFDAAGDLFIAEEYKEALLVVNTNATATTTVTGVSIPPGTIAKILGATSGATPSVCPNSPGTPNGCSYGLSTFNVQANMSEVDGPYAVAVDPGGNVYFSDEYYNFAGKISATGVLTDFAGIQSAPAKKLVRGAAGSFGMGSTFGIAADALANVYITDASSGVIWRVDGAGQSQYVVAGGGTPCSTAVDAYGDGCPATKSTFGSSGTGNYASTSSPGIFGVTVDAYSDLFVGDTITNVIREVASGTQFGVVGTVIPTQTLDIHFGVSDLPAAGNAYTLSAGAANFSLGTATCTANSDGTTDCLLPVTATPTTVGPFTGTLLVRSSLGASASFPLAGISTSSPVTKTTVTASTAACTAGVTGTPATLSITLTARVASSGAPSGTVVFYSNGSKIASQPVAGGVATLTMSFATSSAYNITATYSGDSYFQSSSSAPVPILNFTSTPVSYMESSVVAGGTALYSFNVAQNIFAGLVTLSASGLPANSTASFTPSSVSSSGCSATTLVAMSIVTQQGAISGSSLGVTGHGGWSLLSMGAGFGFALMIGLRRRRSGMRPGRWPMWMVLALSGGLAAIAGCGSGATPAGRTPTGAYTITVVAAGSTGATSTFTVPLTVN